MIVLGVIDIFAVVGGQRDRVTSSRSSGFLYSLFYAITGLAAAWYYRRQSIKSAAGPRDARWLLPLAGAGLLLWVAVKAAQALSGAEERRADRRWVCSGRLDGGRRQGLQGTDL